MIGNLIDKKNIFNIISFVSIKFYINNIKVSEEKIYIDKMYIYIEAIFKEDKHKIEERLEKLMVINRNKLSDDEKINR